jgi:hypothetical protein
MEGPSMTSLPNLLIIGSQKAGTTWLRNRLARHPDVFMSKVKELDFFTRKSARRNLEMYARHFEAGADFKYRGEATPGYFWTYDSVSEYCSLDPSRAELDIPQAVLDTLGRRVRLVVSLRHPVHRAVSAYFHHYKMGRILRRESILEFGKRNGLIDMGFYRRHLVNWERVAGPDAMFVLFFDDIEARGERAIDPLCRFLEIEALDAAAPGEAEHVGLKLSLADNSLVVDLEDSHTFKLLESRSLLGCPRPAIRHEELLTLQRLYDSDIEYVESRFLRQDLQWRKTVELVDFVRTNIGPPHNKAESGEVVPQFGRFGSGGGNGDIASYSEGAMKKILHRLLTWKAKESAPPKQASPAHEIALKHVEAQKHHEGAPEVQVAESDRPVTPTVEATEAIPNDKHARRANRGEVRTRSRTAAKRESNVDLLGRREDGPPNKVSRRKRSPKGESHI